jgi:hypothetical protein
MCYTSGEGRSSGRRIARTPPVVRTYLGHHFESSILSWSASWFLEPLVRVDQTIHDSVPHNTRRIGISGGRRQYPSDPTVKVIPLYVRKRTHITIPSVYSSHLSTSELQLPSFISVYRLGTGIVQLIRSTRQNSAGAAGPGCPCQQEEGRSGIARRTPRQQPRPHRAGIERVCLPLTSYNRNPPNTSGMWRILPLDSCPVFLWTGVQGSLSVSPYQHSPHIPFSPSHSLSTLTSPTVTLSPAGLAATSRYGTLTTSG